MQDGDAVSEMWTPLFNRGRRAVSRDTRYQQVSTKGTPLHGVGGCTAWRDTKSDCSVIVTYEPPGEWHLSIAHHNRYPDWDEIADARYALIPDDAYMVMILPPRCEYVNVHENCFHLHEVPEAKRAALR